MRRVLGVSCLLWIGAFGILMPLSLAFAQGPPPPPPLPQILPNCDPSMPPSARVGELRVPGDPTRGTYDRPPCGVNQFFELLRNATRWLFIIVAPISAVLIMYGGILIMTAAGNTSRVEKGRSVIKTAVVGVIIALSSWMIMRAIYDLLGVIASRRSGLGF